MSNTLEYKLPDVGEGLVEAEIVSWKVEPGDTVQVNDVIVEIETAKSLVELPSPYAGVIDGLLVPEGEVVPVGTPIVSFRTEGESAASGGGKAAVGAARATPEETGAARSGSTEKAGATEEPARTLVGYGPRIGATRRRARRTTPPPAAAPPAPAQAPAARPAPAMPAEPPATPPAPSAPSPVGATDSARPPALAKPPVRKLAKDLGIDLADVPPTGSEGTVTREDVETYHAGLRQAPSTVPAAPGVRETRVPIRGVRRATADAVTRSAFTVPHVTEWLTVDVSRTVELLDRLRARREFGELKLSPLLIAAKACLLALRRTPELNATWDDAAGEIVLKHYVNLGIAAATPRGLIVPHVKDADRLPLPELAQALADLVSTARAGRTQPAETIGTTFTITNVGVFGVDAGTPILNPGETGILAIGAIRKQPWVVDDAVVPRWVTTLALSFDHRIIDGEQGSRFLTDVAGVLEDPGLGLLLA
ncbi:MAG TPA: dihydrolipoamide acetyltransferase family protein [Actinopolymorphaceae bacterium]